MLDEYLPQEQADGCEVIEWIAAQPWCTGAVGMVGISWSGFNSLQIAAHRPPALKAIVTLCSTDDRYADDVHYDGGCVSSDMVQWAASMFMWNARPPDPAIVGERWRDMWIERMEGAPSFIDPWMTHQRRDDYWKQGSVCEDFSRIEAAVYAVGGWADGYTNAIPRMLEGLPGPRKGLIGPWAHAWPQAGPPQPTIGFLQEVIRWFDHWLKGEQNGIMDEPMLRAFIQEPLPPLTCYTEIPGRWVAERAWPPAGASQRVLHLTAGGGLAEEPGPERRIDFSGLQVAGLDAGSWCPYGEVADWPGDQRAMDGMSRCFESAPLDEDIEILGFTDVHLELVSDRPDALISVRLCEVTPDGASTLVTRAQLNLTHRDSDEHPQPLTPGERFRATVRLDACGHRFAAGNRLRIGLSPTYLPWAWPSPEPVTLGVIAGASRAVLPVRARQPEDEALPEFGPPEESAAAGAGRAEAGRGRPVDPPRPVDGPGRAGLRLGRRRPVADAVQRPGVRGREHDDVLDLGGRPAVGAGGLPGRRDVRPRRLADERAHAHRDDRGRGRVPHHLPAGGVRGRRSGLRADVDVRHPARSGLRLESAPCADPFAHFTTTSPRAPTRTSRPQRCSSSARSAA